VDSLTNKDDAARRKLAGSGFVLINHHMEFVMSRFTAAVKAFIADENGVTAIEYGLIAALIGVVIAGTAKTLGTNLNTLFTDVSNKITGA
jgi:pilus assembly protein Flp/PilA